MKTDNGQWPRWSHGVRPGASALLLAALISGCASYEGIEPEGKMVSLNRLSALQAVRDVTISSANWPDRQWWNALGDPHLEALIQEALADSPDMDVALARLRSANAAVGQAGAERLPTVDGSATLSRSRVSEVDDPQGQGNIYSTSRGLSSNFSYDVDLWGGRRAAWSAALGEARATEIDLHEAALTLSVNVARAYVQLAGDYALLDIARQQLERAQTIDNTNQQLQQAGLSDQSARLQSRSSVSTARQALESAEQAVRSDRISLGVLLGKGPDRGFGIERPRSLSPALLSLPSVVPAELVGRRPDVVAARWRVEAQTQQIKADKAQFYPNLNLSAMAGFSSRLGSYFFAEPAKSWSVSPALSLPIFEGGRLRANLDSTEADYDLAVAQYNQTVISALGTVADTITSVQSLDRQRQSLEKARDNAQQAFDLALERFQAGITNYLQVLSTQQQLLDAQQSLVSLNSLLVDTSIQLVQALGGGFHEGLDVPHASGGYPHAPNPQTTGRSSDPSDS
ncbi:efflux transporter outer membrane subunit [Kushneria sp. Sum13]|uniref:efflux transporter outer membrane subunit n=1 Tax=Kushneria sp. Sum13 TaxID=3459196 RepID=UPI004045A769